MDEETLQLTQKLVGTYARQANDALLSRTTRVKELLRHRKLPKDGWDELEIEYFLRELALMDTNNFIGQVGGGEREGRVICPIVSRRHFGMAHGVGRSGDVSEIQPKAAGSSLANQLGNALVLDAIHIAGIKAASSCFLVPTATGMALTLCLLYFKRCNPKATKVLWSRIDQKTCFKAILTAGLEPVVIEPIHVGDELRTDVSRFEAMLEEGPDSILACITTSSCFAPRVPDSVEEISHLCQKKKVFHLVNNAYGLQSSKSCHLIQMGGSKGRIDAFVQSCDKNFLVPVGGAVIAGFDHHTIQAIAKTYPGRASASPCIDVLSTLLWLGAEGWLRLLKERKEVFGHLKEKLAVFATDNGERLLDTKSNPISLAMTLSHLDADPSTTKQHVTELGSMLFTRRCTGTRVVPKDSHRMVEGRDFKGWGAHCNNYGVSYLNIAAAIGMKENEIDAVLHRLDKSLKDLKHKIRRESIPVPANGNEMLSP